jgi:3-deoxy-D-manno-octulosonate 8-phosphate phosphatase (KDO 8-P phosphatase)
MTTQPHIHQAPAMFTPQLLARARGPLGQGISLVMLDVDGVLTDGRLYLSAEGELLKAFHVLDGQGLKFLMRSGVKCAVITGRDSPALRRRLGDLGINDAHLGVANKLVVGQSIVERLGVAWSEVAAMGDDWPDLPLMTRAGLALAPPNAHAEVRARAHHVTRARGGEGAVRELCDLVLMAHGHYAKLLDSDVQALDRPAEPSRGADPPNAKPR